MLTTTTLTAERRRANVRELCDMHSKHTVYPDARMDEKIERSDIKSLTRFGYMEAPSDTTIQNRIIIVSDLMAACAILLGIGSEEALAKIQPLQDEAEKMIESHNNKAPEQNRNTISYTPGNGGFY